ncbi:MAG: hypothetical protein H7Z12_13670 [Rhodospirillaceae bacterium]|nr:hypothetical protein [Rhodospirillales bacterium]
MSMLRRLPALLASLKLTLALLLVAAVVLLWGRVVEQDLTRLLVLPFGGLALNLLAAIHKHERLRRQRGLLVFHVGLAALALVAALGRLMSLQGHVEIAEGTLFDASAVVANVAPFHAWTLDRAEFVQGPFIIRYDPGMQRRETDSTVLLPDGQGGWHEKVVGDDRPLVIGAYRLYTTPNKGFAPVLTWTGADGQSVTGSVHLPSYPMNYENQGNEWPLPDGSRNLVVWLEMPTQVFDENGPWSFRPPTDAKLALVDGDHRVVLAPGEEAEIGGGRVRYDRLAGWMGYTIFYDPTLPWLAALAAVAVLGLAWHVLTKLRGLTEGPAWEGGSHD